jgi:hypothetical protein
MGDREGYEVHRRRRRPLKFKLVDGGETPPALNSAKISGAQGVDLNERDTMIDALLDWWSQMPGCIV